MKVLLLGGTGFVGSHLCSALVAAGHEVAVISNSQPVAPIDSVEYFGQGLESPGLLKKLLPSCSHVIHLASATTPGTSHLAPRREVLGNIQPLAHLLENLQTTPDVHLVFVSTGGAIYGDQLVEMADERTSISPISYYGAAKAASEHFLRAYQAQTGHAVTVLRPSNIYGPRQSVRAGFGIVPTLFDCVRRKIPLELWGDGEAVRDYLYVGDFVDFCLRYIPRGEAGGKFSTFNVGSETGISINELREKVSSISGETIEVVRHPPRGVDVKRIVLDSSAARQISGWAPRTTLDEGLEHTWQWVQSQDSI